MNCSACQTANPEGARFCAQCGTALARRCGGCGAELPAGARFCMTCGQAVGSQSATEAGRLQRLAAAAPHQLAEKMRATRLAGERRVVTALFADVVGSTALVERMDPEDWTGVMNGAFDRLGAAVYRYEGTIARLMGDALLAFFGAPVAHEDDPVRAVRAALDMLSAARQYAEEVRRRHGVEFAVRVGLNSGPVVVGAVGSDLMYEYTAMGDAVNLAARMQAAARPMTVLVAEPVYRAVAPLFECRDVGALEVKGKAEPVRAYEVLGPKAAPGRLRGLAGLESPMVGREVELAALLQAAEVTQAGLGRAVAVVGEAGLGKSRLMAEWRGEVARGQRSGARGQGGAGETAGAAGEIGDGRGSAGAALRWAEGRCLSYGQGLAYHLVLDLLRSLLGVPAAAGEAETRAALRGLCEALFGIGTGAEGLGRASAGAGGLSGAGAGEVYAALGHLLSLQVEGEAGERVRRLDPQMLQRQYGEALRQVLLALAERQPLALVLDDIHWADPSSVELLAKLVPLACEARLLWCLVTRPDREAPGWRLLAAAREALGAGYVELALAPLDERHSRELLRNLLAFEALPERLRAQVLAKAEGNPFFVEEVIRMLIDRGAIVREGDQWTLGRQIEQLEIPDNLQGLLLARIDRLPEEVKRTLRVASVIGRQFPVRVLEEVVGT